MTGLKGLGWLIMNSLWMVIPGIALTTVLMLELMFAAALLLWKQLNSSTVALKADRESPCKHCQFFVNNPHLPCAVQPSLVLKRSSQHCRDYCSSALTGGK